MYRHGQEPTSVANRVAPTTPEAITTEFVNRARAGDAEGLAELYSKDAVMAFPPGERTQGRDEILKVFECLLLVEPEFEYEDEDDTTTVEYHGELALTSTPALGGVGARVQVAQRQADGTWLRLLDNPYPGRVAAQLD